jgi:hypothetical protein
MENVDRQWSLHPELLAVQCGRATSARHGPSIMATGSSARLPYVDGTSQSVQRETRPMTCPQEYVCDLALFSSGNSLQRPSEAVHQREAVGAWAGIEERGERDANTGRSFLVRTLSGPAVDVIHRSHRCRGAAAITGSNAQEGGPKPCTARLRCWGDVSTSCTSTQEDRCVQMCAGVSVRPSTRELKGKLCDRQRKAVVGVGRRRDHPERAKGEGGAPASAERHHRAASRSWRVSGGA